MFMQSRQGQAEAAWPGRPTPGDTQSFREGLGCLSGPHPECSVIGGSGRAPRCVCALVRAQQHLAWGRWHLKSVLWPSLWHSGRADSWHMWLCSDAGQQWELGFAPSNQEPPPPHLLSLPMASGQRSLLHQNALT